MPSTDTITPASTQRADAAQERFRSALVKARNSREFTCAHVGDIIGVSGEFIRQIEHGTRDPDWSIVARLALLFDLDLTKLVLGQMAAAKRRRVAA